MMTSKKKLALITTMIFHTKWDELFTYCLQLGLNPLLITKEINFMGGRETPDSVERRLRIAIEEVPNVKG